MKGAQLELGVILELDFNCWLISSRKFYLCMKLCWSGAVSLSTACKPRCWLDSQHRNTAGTPVWAGHALAHTTGAENKQHKKDDYFYSLTFLNEVIFKIQYVVYKLTCIPGLGHCLLFSNASVRQNSAPWPASLANCRACRVGFLFLEPCNLVHLLH